ncbi:Serine proteinase inhibitor IA-1 [Hypsizygus marmoreus]|uniref:Serine proteinase inhibitor IA-1 n=1 Tax=Hypsizygus marmoreus TaxID=39966 RepID=A0A369JAI8_HYPMA|nr:Serine proteinase inhibitor IA-1 [Hypsizygus marmoreus]
MPVMPLTKSIIIFKDTATEDEIQDLMEQVKEQGGHITNTYDILFKGFAAVLSGAHLNQLQSLARSRDSTIDYIESDGTVTTFTE